MLLTGTFLRAVDDKQRIALPKPIRGALPTIGGTVLFVAPGTDGSLSLFTEEAFGKLAARLAESSPAARDVRDYTRLFYARAARVELDGQGRMRVPQELADLIGLGKEVVLLGVGEHLELWDKERWDSYLASKQDSYDEIAEAAFADPRTLGRVESETLVRSPK